jgi:hypothetical protein
MKKILLLVFLTCLIMLPISLSGQDTNAKKNVTGSWVGKLTPPGMDLKIVFNLKLVEKDSLVATLDSPDQNAYGIPCGEVVLNKQKLVIKAPDINGEYVGTIKGDSLNGTWSQNGGTFPLNLKKQTTPPEVQPK